MMREELTARVARQLHRLLADLRFEVLPQFRWSLAPPNVGHPTWRLVLWAFAETEVFKSYNVVDVVEARRSPVVASKRERDLELMLTHHGEFINRDAAQQALGDYLLALDAARRLAGGPR